MSIAVGEKRQIYNPNTNEIFCVDITDENIARIQRYDIQDKTETDWRFGDTCSANIPTATILFTENDNGLLKIDVVPSVDEDVLRWHQQMDGGGRRSRKVKKSKSFKKRPTRRGRSSKSRKSRKSRKARKSRTTRRK